MLLALTHLAVTLGIPFGLPVLGIESPYDETISGFEVALLSGIVTFGLVHFAAGIAHVVVRLIGTNGNYLGLLAAFAFTGCVGIIALPVGLIYEWATRQEVLGIVSIVLPLGAYPMLVLVLLVWASVLAVLAVKSNYGVKTGVGVVAVVTAGALLMPVALILYTFSFYIPCPLFVGC